MVGFLLNKNCWFDFSGVIYWTFKNLLIQNRMFLIFSDPNTHKYNLVFVIFF